MWYQTNQAVKQDEFDVSRYPIGPFFAPERVTWVDIVEKIGEVEQLPALLCQAVSGLSEVQLETPYRAEGWTVRQVVHHLADSHINAYVRFKCTVTEDLPTVKTYEEEKWAELIDGKACDIEISLTLLEALHRRWVMFLRSLSESDFKREYNHPALGRLKLSTVLYIYSWHGKHHVAHITGLRERMKWQ